MKFEEVLPALKSGKKIRKRHWYKDTYVYINLNGEFETQSGKHFFISLDRLSDLEDDRWEIVKETKKVKLRDLTEEQYKKWYSKRRCHYENCETCVCNSVFCVANDIRCWFYHKDLYSDKFLDQEIEIEEEK